MHFLHLTYERRDVTKMWTLVSGLVLLVVVQTVTSASLEFDTLHCLVSLDPVYGGNLTDCSDWDLSNVSRLHGLPHNTTTLILDRTDITGLRENFFRDNSLSSLRHLSVRESNLATIEVGALSGLFRLQTLDLERNNLPFCQNRSFPPGMFDHVPNLRNLFIGFNIVYTDVSSDCQTYENNIDIFSALPHLTNLTIDAVSGTLDMGQQFSNLTHLTNLTVVCNKVSYISNSSLRALRRLPLVVLNLVELRREDTPLEAGVFQDLSSLRFLSLDGIHVSNHGILLALQPFSNRSMEDIKLVRTNIFQTFNIPTYIFNDGIVNEDARFLSSICVRHFSWINSVLFAVKPNILSRGTWRTCLESLDFSRNKLENTGWLTDVFEMNRFKNMEYLALSSTSSPPSEDIPRLVHFSLSDLTKGHGGAQGTDVRDSVDNHKEIIGHGSAQGTDVRDSVDNHEEISSSVKRVSGFSHPRHHYQFAHPAEIANQRTMTSRGGNTDHLPETMTSRGGNTDLASEIMTSRGDNTNLLSDIMTSFGGHSDDFPEVQPARRTGQTKDDFHFHFPYNGNITVYLPAALERIKVINIIFAGITLEYWTVLVGGNKLKQLYWVNNDLLRVRGRLYGLETLKVLGLSGSTFDIASHVMDNFQGLEVLLLDNVKPDTFFHTNSLPRLLRNLTNLRYLDVSNNRLNSQLFPRDTFASTPNISHVILSQNRFSNIPFDLQTTPNLRVLDLSSNAILFLTDQEMLALDNHVARGGSLTLRLQGNGIACVCSQATFIVWAFRTAVNLDERVTFNCLTENLQKVNVTDIDDIPEFTRLCQGRDFLTAAIILYFVVIVVFLSTFLVGRFWTSLQALVLGIFVRAFRPMGPGDYRTNVFIGYADDDYVYVRGILLRYLEEDLQQTTFVHQRDLRAGFTDQQFYDAISNSWRVLLVLSKRFLTSYRMAHIVMQYASHSVTPVNQHRVFVLLEETQVSVLPDYLDGVLDDTRIILLPDLHQNLTNQQKQMIRECLRAS